MDLSLILASPKLKPNSNVKLKIDQLDKILKNMDSYNTTKVDIEQLNREAKIEAKKRFYEEFNGLQLHLPKLDQQVDVFNKACCQISNFIDKESIFKNQPFILFNKDDLFHDRTQNFSEKLIKDILTKENKLKMFKVGLKMISLESDLDNISLIKKLLINETISISIEDVYATLFKILINYGIDLELLDRYVFKYQNIKENALFKRSRPKDKKSEEEDFDLNLIQSFIHIIDMIKISVNSAKITDYQILADFVSIVLILHSEKKWRFNLQCSNALSHLLILVLRYASNFASIKIVSKTILRYFKNKYEEFFEFLDFFPDNTTNLSNLKFALCKIALKKYEIKVGHTKQRVNITFNRLNELRLKKDEIKLVISLIDHFYKTRELDETLSQQISDELAKFSADKKFECKNQSSIDLRQYLIALINEYDQKAKSVKKRKIKGECMSSVRKFKIKEDKEIQEIWQELELDLNDY